MVAVLPGNRSRSCHGSAAPTAPRPACADAGAVGGSPTSPTVARTSYVDPRVIDAFLAGETIAPAHERGRRTIEAAVLEVIDG